MLRLGVLMVLIGFLGCSSIPEVKHDWHQFPKEAFLGIPKDKKYQKLGLVKSKVNYATLDPRHDEDRLCKNYFNKAVEQLVKYAKKNGGDAVIEVRSIVRLYDGKTESHASAECFDDGGEGQVLTKGIAIKWITDPIEEKLYSIE